MAVTQFHLLKVYKKPGITMIVLNKIKHHKLKRMNDQKIPQKFDDFSPLDSLPGFFCFSSRILLTF